MYLEHRVYGFIPQRTHEYLFVRPASEELCDMRKL
jgi:hypothetical protein